MNSVFIILSALMFAPAPVLIQKEDAGIKEGRYLSAGLEHHGKKHSGFVVIEKDGEAYTLIYVLTPEDGGDILSYRGLGVLDKGKLIVSWRTGEGLGLSILTVSEGLLSGQWYAHGAKGEELMKARAK